MACEKVAKAYRCRKTDAPLFGEGGLLTNHGGFEKFIPLFMSSPQVKRRYQGRSEQLQREILTMRRIAGAIEKLAPVGKKDDLPNAEYPWRRGAEVCAPAQHSFAETMKLLSSTAILKLVKSAIDEF